MGPSHLTRLSDADRCCEQYWGAQMLGSRWIGTYLDSGVAKRAKAVEALKVLAVLISATWLLAAYFNESRSLSPQRDVPVGDAEFEQLGVAAAGGTSDGVEEVWELNDCAEPQAVQTAGGSYGLKLGWSGHAYDSKASAASECWAAIALPLVRGVTYRASFQAADWSDDGVAGAALYVQSDGVEVLRAVPGAEFESLDAIFTPPIDSSAADPVLRFSATGGTLVIDSIKVEREGLDIFSDFGAAIGPFFLYFSWGFLDAFIQNYAFWVFGQLTDDLALTARFSGYMKFVGCLGAAAGWKAGVIGSLTQIVINLVLFGLAVPFAWRATSALGERRLDLGLAASLAGSVNAQLDIGS